MAKKNGKTILIMFLIFVLVILLTIGATLAYLKSMTGEEISTFTVGNGVAIELEEVEYDKDTKKDAFTAGAIISKDPTVFIPASGMEKEYVAVTVDYVIEKEVAGAIVETHVTYEQFKNTYATIASYSNAEKTDIELDRLNAGWVTIDNYKTFYYGTCNADKDAITALTPLVKGTKATVFDKIVIKQPYPVYTDTIDQNHRKEQLVNFKILIQAYAVQGDLTVPQALATFKQKLNLDIGASDYEGGNP